MANEISPAVSTRAVEQLIQGLCMGRTHLHAVKLYRGDELLLRYAVSPYRCDDRREIYSLSKIFTSTACGLCYDRKLLTPDDRVEDWFPEYREQWKKDERFARLKIRHLLTMSTGHDHCVMGEMAMAEDSVKAFFETPLCYEPGERFVYSTGATCLAAEIVRRASGKNVPDLLAEKVLPTLGIEPFFYECCADGHCVGGSGFNLSCDDVAQLGRLYLGRGVYQGERLLSDEWVRMATSSQIDNNRNLTPDWSSGYGFQFWQCAGGGFRGDGAFGQLCVIVPEKNLVFTMLGECVSDMQAEMDAVHGFLHSFEQKDKGLAKVTECYTAKHSWYPCAWFDTVTERPDCDTGERLMNDNAAEIETVRLVKQEKQAKLMLRLYDGTVETITANADTWTDGKLYLKNYKPVLRELISRKDRQCIRYSALLCPDCNAVVFELRLRNTPQSMQLRLWENGGRLVMKSICASGLVGSDIQLIER